jgi:hypothetical protein
MCCNSSNTSSDVSLSNLWCPYVACLLVCGLQSTIKTIPLHACVLLLGVPLLLGVLNFMWFVKIVRGAYKLVFKKQVAPGEAAAKTQPAAAAAGRGCAKKMDSRIPDGVVSIKAYTDSGSLKAEHFN